MNSLIRAIGVADNMLNLMVMEAEFYAFSSFFWN